MSATPQMRGLFPPMITPFSESGEIDESALRRLVNFLIDKGIHGLFVCGSYGSFPLLTLEERRQVAEITFDEVKGRIPVIVHVATPCTGHSVDLARHAEGLGAMAVSSVVPYYYSSFGYDERDLLGYYEALVDAVDIPVHIYNNPKTTGFAATTDLLLKLHGVGVSGLKDSSGQIMLLAEHIREMRNRNIDFTFAIGTTGLLLPAIALGVRGCVAGTANALPEVMVELYDVLQAGDFERGAELQLRVIEIRKLQGIQGFRPPACYSILKMRGLDMGTCRRPWKELDPGNYRTVERRLKELGVI